jgi:hypothetical protein
MSRRGPSSARDANGGWSRSVTWSTPEPGEVLRAAGDPYDLYLVLAGGVCLVDQRDARVVFARGMCCVRVCCATASSATPALFAVSHRHFTCSATRV